MTDATLDEGAAGSWDHIERKMWVANALEFVGRSNSPADACEIIDRLLAVIDAHPSPTPAADADRVRIAVEAYETMRLAWSFRQASALHSDRAQYHFACGAFDRALDASDEALAALKSTAAQEGGSK